MEWFDNFIVPILIHLFLAAITNLFYRQFNRGYLKNELIKNAIVPVYYRVIRKRKTDIDFAQFYWKESEVVYRIDKRKEESNKKATHIKLSCKAINIDNLNVDRRLCFILIDNKAATPIEINKIIYGDGLEYRVRKYLGTNQQVSFIYDESLPVKAVTIDCHGSMLIYSIKSSEGFLKPRVKRL